jgi:hypothetical protein
MLADAESNRSGGLASLTLFTESLAGATRPARTKGIEPSAQSHALELWDAGTRHQPLPTPHDSCQMGRSLARLRYFFFSSAGQFCTSVSNWEVPLLGTMMRNFWPSRLGANSRPMPRTGTRNSRLLAPT